MNVNINDVEKVEDIRIFYEDKYIIVCEKPAGVPSQNDKSLSYDMISKIKNYIKIKENVKGEPFVGLVHRLDRPVAGIMVFAKDSNALKKLNELIRNKQFKKFYRAISDNHAKDIEIGKRTLLTHYLVKNGGDNASSVVYKNVKNSKLSQLYYTVLKSDKNGTLIDIELVTGRHHQIRVQMAEINLPIWGDSKYNLEFQSKNPDLKWFDIALYAYKLEFPHPITNKIISIQNIPDKYQFQL